jgi:hypothetical protein
VHVYVTVSDEMNFNQGDLFQPLREQAKSKGRNKSSLDSTERKCFVDVRIKPTSARLKPL